MDRVFLLFVTITLLTGCTVQDLEDEKWSGIIKETPEKIVPTQPEELENEIVNVGEQTSEMDEATLDEAEKTEMEQALSEGENLVEDLANLEKLEQEVNEAIAEIEEIELNLAELDALTKELDELDQLEQDLEDLEELLGE
jgi:DNA repair exonuclease SbcCD ATPase subunit